MFYFFPDPYPDELFLSIITRYYKLTDNISIQAMLIKLFGTGSPLSLYFAKNLAFFCKNLRHKDYTPKYFIDNHTLYPYYSLFLPEKQREILIKKMINKYKSGSTLELTLGINAASICMPSFLRFCAKCIDEDSAIYGEPYIHRMHQTPGCFVCNKHKTTLVNYNIKNNSFKLIDFNNMVDFVRNAKCDNQQPDIVYKISEDIQSLYENIHITCGIENIQNKYIGMLKDKGLARLVIRKNSHLEPVINRSRLYEYVKSNYSENILNYFESPLNSDIKNNWLISIATYDKSRFINPLRHLMFIRFLFGSFKNMLDYNSVSKRHEYFPFGEGPFQCLNPVADHYMENTIDKCKLKKSKNGQLIGIFECKCGFIYSSIYSDQFGKMGIGTHKVIEYGVLWEEELKKQIKLLDGNISATAREMSCKYYIVDKFIKNESKITKGNCTNKNCDNMEKVYLSDLLNVIKENPTITRTALLQKVRKQYTWLKKYRMSVIEGLIPIDKRKDTGLNQFKTNWKQRDKEISTQIPLVVEKILNSEKPIKLTRKRILGELKQYNLGSKSMKFLVNSMKLIKKYEESTEDFIKRKVNRSFKLLKSHDSQITKSLVLANAGVHRKVDESIYEYINELLS